VVGWGLHGGGRFACMERGHGSVAAREGGEGRGAISPTRSDLSSWTSEWPLGWRWGEDVVCSVRRRGPEGRVCKGMIDGWMD
jgi:hypothetical protein